MSRFFATARRYLRWCWVSLKLWLRNEPRNFEESFYLTINCWFALSAWSFLAVIILTITGAWSNITSSDLSPAELLAWAGYEELTFRLLFLGPPIFFWRKLHIPVLLLMSAVSSAIFGLAHGDYTNLLLQGVGGFILCLFFIKAASADSMRNRIFQLRALAITTFAHALYNIITARMLD